MAHLLGCVSQKQIEPGKKFRGKRVEGWFIPTEPPDFILQNERFHQNSLTRIKEALPEGANVCVVLFSDGSETNVILNRRIQ